MLMSASTVLADISFSMAFTTLRVLAMSVVVLTVKAE